MQLLRLARPLFRLSTQVLRTQVFHSMSDKELATPQLVKRALTKRIPQHGKVSLVSLYHGKRVRHAIKSCFSEKKSKKFKRVHKIKKYFFSQILNKKLYVRMSNKAYRCIKKMGSFDNYIVLTPPKRLDSKIGEYYRTLMMKKINDPEYRIPYVIGSGRKVLMHRYHRYRWIQQNSKIIIPKDFKKKLITYQRRFGTTVDQLNEDEYQKYLEVERLKKLWGKEMDNKHPLLQQIQSKLNVGLTDQEVRAMEEKAREFTREYLQHPKNRQLRQQSHQYNLREGQKEHLKVKEAFIKKALAEQQAEQELQQQQQVKIQKKSKK